MDLFSFLDENDVETTSETQLAANVLHKRKHPNGTNPVELTGQDSYLDRSGSSKKPRLSSPNPIVLDDFETEAKREIEASAGLTGTAETGARLELRHQVLYTICTDDAISSENLLPRFDIRWPFHLAIPTLPFPSMCHLQSPIGNINLSLILSKRFPSMLYNEMKAFSFLPIRAQEKRL